MNPPALPAPPGAAASSPRGVLWALLAGNAVIGTGVMTVPGTLNEISGSLGVSVAVAGQLISTGAILMCLGAPAFAALVARWDRRRLLALAMAWYAVMHFACALAPSFGWLLALRVVALVPCAVFTPQAAACVGQLVPPEQRGRAIAFIFLGWSLASVLGMPFGAYVGGTFGWRQAFVAVGGLSIVSAVWVWRAMPDGVRPPVLSLAAWQETFRSRAVMTTVAVTVLCAAGQFTQFSYFAPYFRQAVGAGPRELSLFFMWFGAFGLLGNVLMARYIDRIGAHRAVMASLALIALTLLLFPLGTTLGLAGLVAVPWALGCFASNSAQQARVVALAPGLAAASVALNSSGIYAGQAIGTAAGGWLVAHDGMAWLHWGGFAGIVAAMVASALATRFARRAG